jgi:hypothetical protein
MRTKKYKKNKINKRKLKKEFYNRKLKISDYGKRIPMLRTISNYPVNIVRPVRRGERINTKSFRNYTVGGETLENNKEVQVDKLLKDLKSSIISSKRMRIFKNRNRGIINELIDGGGEEDLNLNLRERLLKKNPNISGVLRIVEKAKKTKRYQNLINQGNVPVKKEIFKVLKQSDINPISNTGVVDEKESVKDKSIGKTEEIEKIKEEIGDINRELGIEGESSDGKSEQKKSITKILDKWKQYDDQGEKIVEIEKPKVSTVNIPMDELMGKMAKLENLYNKKSIIKGGGKLKLGKLRESDNIEELKRNLTVVKKSSDFGSFGIENVMIDIANRRKRDAAPKQFKEPPKGVEAYIRQVAPLSSNVLNELSKQTGKDDVYNELYNIEKEDEEESNSIYLQKKEKIKEEDKKYLNKKREYQDKLRKINNDKYNEEMKDLKQIKRQIENLNEYSDIKELKRLEKQYRDITNEKGYYMKKKNKWLDKEAKDDLEGEFSVKGSVKSRDSIYSDVSELIGSKRMDIEENIEDKIKISGKKKSTFKELKGVFKNDKELQKLIKKNTPLIHGDAEESLKDLFVSGKSKYRAKEIEELKGIYRKQLSKENEGLQKIKNELVQNQNIDEEKKKLGIEIIDDKTKSLHYYYNNPFTTLKESNIQIGFADEKAGKYFEDTLKYEKSMREKSKKKEEKTDNF